MSDIYKNLAGHLDNLPGGYPSTESGVELRILRRLFTQEEADIAQRLSMKPETVASIAKRTELPSEKLAESLEEMAGKGLIFRGYKDETIVSYVYCQNTIEDGAAWTGTPRVFLTGHLW